jgi:hypothetical protein
MIDHPGPDALAPHVLTDHEQPGEAQISRIFYQGRGRDHLAVDLTDEEAVGIECEERFGVMNAGISSLPVGPFHGQVDLCPLHVPNGQRSGGTVHRFRQLSASGDY